MIEGDGVCWKDSKREAGQMVTPGLDWLLVCGPSSGCVGNAVRDNHTWSLELSVSWSLGMSELYTHTQTHREREREVSALKLIQFHWYLLALTTVGSTWFLKMHFNYLCKWHWLYYERSRGINHSNFSDRQPGCAWKTTEVYISKEPSALSQGNTACSWS